MFIDITLKITPEMITEAHKNDTTALPGHLGTHFDVMNKEFPLEYLKRDGIVFDVSKITDRDISVSDIELDQVKPDMFVAFYTGFIETESYGGKRYFMEHPQLSNELIDALIEKKISIIGIDFAGVKRGIAHTPTDQYCADRGIFIVENLCNLKTLLNEKKSRHFMANTYPVSYAEMTGLPCRAVAELEW